jgi:hypothetical protein
MEKGVMKLVVFHGEDFGYWKNRTCNYLLSQGRVIWEIVQEACGPLAYTDNEHAKQLLYAVDDHVWGMKITTLEEYADFVTLDTEKLFSKFKSHEFSRKGHPNHDASFTSKALITSALYWWP